MENLQIVKTENGKTAVQCSELYRALGLRNNNYTRWYKKNIINNPFAVEGVDYILLPRKDYEINKEIEGLTSPKETIRKETNLFSSQNGGIPLPKEEISKERDRLRQTDFVLSLDFAKKLAMLARTDKGEAVRNYFLECERKAQALDNHATALLIRELNNYRRMEQIRIERNRLNREARAIRRDMAQVQAMQTATNQLTLIFN